MKYWLLAEQASFKKASDRKSPEPESGSGLFFVGTSGVVTKINRHTLIDRFLLFLNQSGG